MTLTTLCLLLAVLPPGEEIKPTQMWGDVLQDESLRKLSPKSGFFTDEQSFAKIWKAWRPDEKLPSIDFDEAVVLVATADGPNQMFAYLRKTDGNVNAVFGSTKIGGPGFGYLFAVLPREGIKSINNQPLDPDAGDESPKPPTPDERPDRDYVLVTVRGTLETGLAAIGGETTGMVIRSNGMAFEVEIDDAKQRMQADKLNGKPATVVGELRRQPGVERGPRWIIDVQSIGPVERGRPVPRGEPRRPVPQ
ncbi:MAG: hypothetical protein WBC44_17030 [Planctomycetaceae bacterium]